MIFRNFRKNIEDVINNSGMSIDAVYYILKDVMIEVEKLYNDYCYQEDIAMMQENEKNSEEDAEAEVKEEDTEAAAGQE